MHTAIAVIVAIAVIAGVVIYLAKRAKASVDFGAGSNLNASTGSQPTSSPDPTKPV